MAFAAALLLFAAAPAAFASRGASTPGPATLLLRAVNAARAQYGLHTLRADATLRRAAISHSLDMVRRNYFAHGAFRNRMIAFHVAGPSAGENLAWGNGTYAEAQTIVQEWLASPEHRANLLRPGFRRIGIGIATGTFLGAGDASVVTADFAGR